MVDFTAIFRVVRNRKPPKMLPSYQNIKSMTPNLRKSMFQSSNPAMKAFAPEKLSASQSGVLDSMHTGEAMTISGAVNKTGILLAILVATGMVSWYMTMNGSPLVMPMLWGGLIGGLIVAFIIIFKKEMAPTLAPVYVTLKGLMLGVVSAMYASMYNGIVIQAIGLTICVLALMLLIYQSGLIKVTQKFRMGVVMATGAVMIVYVISFVLGFFGMQVPMLHDNGIFGIGISLVIVGIASMNLLLDFDSIEKGAQANAPKYMEWFAAFGLMMTLIWLYLELLRLLAKIYSRD